jgi:seryl-tRNA synthetase
LKAEKAAIEVDIAALVVKSKEAEEVMKKSAQSIGNIVHSSVPVSETEVDHSVLTEFDSTRLILRFGFRMITLSLERITRMDRTRK